MNNILNVIIKYYKYLVNVSSLYDYYLHNRNQVTYIGISNFDIIENTLSDQNVMYTEKKITHDDKTNTLVPIRILNDDNIVWW